MTSQEPGRQSALPWLRSGPLRRVSVEAWPELDAHLTAWRYRRVELDGRKMTSRAAVHAELKSAFGLPEWYGANWDAFGDSFGEFLAQNTDARLAILWHHIDQAAAVAPATIVEVGWALLAGAQDARTVISPDARGPTAVDVFVIGEGIDFGSSPCSGS